MAMEANKLDVAQKTYEQAQELDPHNAQARGGLVLIEKMKDGKKSREEMLKELRLDAGKREVARLEKGKRRIVVLDEAEDREEPKEKDKDKDRDQPRDPLEDVKVRRRI